MAYSQAQNRATQKYQLANYERIAVRCRKGKKEIYEQLAKDRGVSLNALILELLENEVKKGSN